MATLVYSKQTGSMASKAILSYCADRANDDGTGFWASKQRIAREVECSKQTVITTIRKLVADGLLREVGRRSNPNGYTFEYAIVVEAIEALPSSKPDIQEVQNLTGQNLDGSNELTPRGQPPLPKPSFNRPSQKTSSSSITRAAPKTSPPDEFAPKPLRPGSAAAAIRDGWPPGREVKEIEAFLSKHRSKGTRFADWQEGWVNWILQSEKFEHHGKRSNSAGHSSGFQPSRDIDLAYSKLFPEQHVHGLEPNGGQKRIGGCG